MDEADLRVVCGWFGFEVVDGHVTNKQDSDLREFLDAGHARSVPGWFIPPGRRRGDVDSLGLGAPPQGEQS